MAWSRKTTSGSLRQAITAAAALLMVTTGALAAFAAPAITVKDGVTRVANGAQPSGKREVVTLQEAWRVGGDEGEDFFGLITQVRVGKDGRIYLLDTRLAEVPVYDREGKRVATLSREGDGPGESRLPANLVFMPDGTLGLAQIFPGKIIKINLDGSPAGSFTPGGADPTQGGFLQLFDCSANGSDLVVTAESIAQAGTAGQDRTNYVALMDAAGKEKVRFLERKSHLDFAAFEFNEDKTDRVDFRKVAVGRDGRVYIAGTRNRYAIDVYGKDGKLQRVIERAFEHRARTDEEYQRLQTMVQAQLAQLPGAKVAMSHNEPDISAIEFGSDGNLWVSNSRSGHGQPAGIMFTWDVFTPDGEFIKQVSAKCAGDGKEDSLIWTPDGNAVLVTGFLEAALSLQGGGGAADDDKEAPPMEVVYLKRVGS
ncbi:MAG: hypothetical protein IPG61_17395 [bacterium]|nr:hypothetical protein [bacterium]